MSVQLQHDQYPFKSTTFPLVVVCDDVNFKQNIGSLFRICEAFGVAKIYFCGEDLQFSPRKINKTSRSTHLHVPYEIVDNKVELINSLKETYQILALEITNDSQNIRTVKIDPEKPIALILGNEIDGISPELLSLVDKAVHIEMFGKNSSINVVQAAGIAIYEIINQLKSLVS